MPDRMLCSTSLSHCSTDDVMSTWGPRNVFCTKQDNTCTLHANTPLHLQLPGGVEEGALMMCRACGGQQSPTLSCSYTTIRQMSLGVKSMRVMSVPSEMTHPCFIRWMISSLRRHRLDQPLRCLLLVRARRGVEVRVWRRSRRTATV